MLDPIDKVTIAAGLTLLVILVFLIVVCKVSPLCWLHDVCPLTKEDAEKRKRGKFYGTTKIYEVKPPCGKIRKKKKENAVEENKTPVPVDPVPVPVQTSFDSLSNGKLLQSLEVNGVQTWGKIKFSLHFIEDKEHLIIKIFEVDDISDGLLQGATSLFIKIFVINPNSLNKSNTDVNCGSPDEEAHKLPLQLQTKIVKKTNHLIFDETFYINMTALDLKSVKLRIQWLQFDKFSRSNIIGQVIVILKDLHLLQELILWKDFKKYEQELGDILISLSYLPTSERLSVTIQKVKNLKVIASHTKPNPFIKVILSHGKNVLEVKKTSVRTKEQNPTYNENLYFDIPATKIDFVVLTVSVVHKENPDDEKSEKSTIGKVKLGHSIMGSAQRHWKEMKLAPRKSISKWYSLY